MISYNLPMTHFIDAKMSSGKVTGANVSVKITDNSLSIISSFLFIFSPIFIFISI